MIRAATAAELAALVPDSEAAVRIAGLAAAYGTERPFVRFWSGEGGSRIALMDGLATVAACPQEREELALFLSMHPEIAAVRTDAALAQTLAAAGWAVKTGEVMTPAVRFAPPEAPVEALPAREMYPVLAAVFGETVPPFDVWYADVSHRLRHDAARIAGIRENGQAVAVAMTTAECSGAALIGAVATLPASRGKGYAAACVSSLAAQLQREGRRVLLSPKNDRAKALYTRLGFVVCGEWGLAERVLK